MNPAAPQPAPVGEGRKVLPAVWQALALAGVGTPGVGVLISSLCERAKAGEKKYGTPLKTDNGRDAFVDAFQEAQDAVMYLGQKVMEDPFNVVASELFSDAVDLAVRLAEVVEPPKF